MYRNYISRGGYHTAASTNNTSISPPWATYNAPESDNGNRSGMGSRGSRGGDDNRSAHSPAARTNGSRERIRPRTTRHIRRYGRRFLGSPRDRDLPFFHRIFRHRMPSRGSESNREREIERREERAVEERRAEIEDNARRDVEPEVPLRKNVLTVMGSELNLLTNTKNHHTHLYECTDRDADPQLVVRRGQPFMLTFSFQRPWDIQNDDMMIQFELGEKPSEYNGTLHQLPVDEFMSNQPMNLQGWAAKLLEQKENDVTVAVFVPADAIVGEWKFGVTTSLVGSDEQFIYDGIGEIFIIFNPWCQDDQVYFSDDPGLLEEYILNEYGCVFEGNSEFIGCKPWFYGQFRNGILDICMTIMRLAFEIEISKDMADVITVTRKLSRVLNNSSRDPGVMTGNWSGNYSGGERPSSWRSSVQILQQFARTKLPVKFAQCFVFSHLFTTVLRALGIPSRSLTNFESAHDTDKSVTIDSYQDEEGNDLPSLSRDSIWNYHCWNDVWINRPDLDLTASSSDRYSGWHAIDATPQEESQGRYQCGPSPLAAIRNGEVSVGFDTQFIYGEVNGEVCTWMIPSDGSKNFKLMERQPNAVGKQISTKFPDGKPARGTFAPGKREVHERRLEITPLYKHSEGSEEERNSLKTAVGDGFGARIFQNSAGVGLEIGQIHNVALGSNFEIKTILLNQSSENKEIDLTLGAYPMDYRSERRGWGKIAFEDIKGIKLPPNSRQVFSLNIMEKFYIEQCDSSMSIMLRASAKVKGEDKPLSKLKKIVLATPEVIVKTLTPASRLTREMPFTVSVLVTNLCSKPMTSCRLHLGGTIEPTSTQGFQEQDGTFFKKIKDIFPNEIRNVNIEVKAQKRPLKKATRELDVDVLSLELPEMSGSLNIELA